MQKLQQANARYLRAVPRAASQNSVDLSVTVESPPSIALGGIQRCFEAFGNVLELTAAVAEQRTGGPVAEHHVAVEYEPHPNRLAIGRHYDRIELTWRFEDVTLPSFRGRLTIRPAGTKTSLGLKGSSEPGHDGIVQAAARVLLEHFKAILERDFETLREQLPPDKPE